LAPFQNANSLIIKGRYQANFMVENPSLSAKQMQQIEFQFVALTFYIYRDAIGTVF
jgi:hypothetical protein